VIRVLLLALVWLAAVPAAGHEFRPTLLRFDVGSDGRHDLVWKWDGLDPRGIRGDELTFEGCEVSYTDTSVGDERMTRIELVCPGASFLLGLPRPAAEVVIDARFDGRPVEVRRIRAAIDFIDSAEFLPELSEDAGPVRLITVGDWVLLGVEHIVTGWDHLAFVLALTLLVARVRRLLLVVTGFTVGHSLTLGLTTLGLIQPPSSAPVEATIALSIAYLAVELSRDGASRDQFGRTRGVAVATGFGLIHGFGFAGVLRALSLPVGGEWRALLGFNLGVELGQLAFVAALLIVIRLSRRWSTTTEPVPAGARWVAAYGLGALGVFWTLERGAQVAGL
jgi:hydrogenase/urease accessory protein HupE